MTRPRLRRSLAGRRRLVRRGLLRSRSCLLCRACRRTGRRGPESCPLRRATGMSCLWKGRSVTCATRIWCSVARSEAAAIRAAAAAAETAAIGAAAAAAEADAIRVTVEPVVLGGSNTNTKEGLRRLRDSETQTQTQRWRAQKYPKTLTVI